MKYLVDSNYFIQAHRSIYPLDIVPSFWNKTQDLASRELIVSIDKVKSEIYDKSSHEDHLKEWCSENLSEEFFENTDLVIANYALIAQWASSMNHHYRKYYRRVSSSRHGRSLASSSCNGEQFNYCNI